MRNPNADSFEKFSNESLADELIRFFKKRHHQRQETKTKKLSNILQPLIWKTTKRESFTPTKNISHIKIKIPKKQVVIKNIGNLKANHLKNSLNYVITNTKNPTQDLDDSHLINAIEYASRSATSIIDENGNAIDSSQSILKAWADDLKNQRANANLAWHLTFSIDEPITDENLSILQQSVRESLDLQLKGEYKFMIAIHSHQNKPHCHAIINKTNTFTKKKLHFNNRDEIKEFFFDLREQFKNSLCYHSKGKLLYDNSYAYERDLYSKKLKELEEINLADFSSHKTFDFNGYLEKILFDLQKKESVLSSNKEAFEKQIKELIKAREKIAKGIDIISLLDNKKYNELSGIIKQKAKQYKSNNALLRKITSDLESIKLFNQTIRNNLTNMSVLRQKESLIKSFKQSRNVSKDTSNKILLLEQELNLLKKHQKENSISIISSFSSNIKRLNAKSNLFILVPMHDNLIKYKNALDTFGINDDSKNKELDENKQRTELLIDNRLKFLLQSLQSALAKQDEVDERYLKRFAKNMDFMIKEIGYGVNFLSTQDEALFKNLCKEYKFTKNLTESIIKETNIAESNINSIKSMKEKDKEQSKTLDANKQTKEPDNLL